MSVNCTDNSTECLLRALIETVANQHSPWEPRSFGFTVAIGVAAFLISFVAIFQGLLAAGPGRIKASSNAIGTFSKLTKGSVSWIEFAWRSTAYVPFVNFDTLREGLNKQAKSVPHGTNYPFSAGSINTGATWLQLFRSIGLNEEVSKIFGPVLQPCATDHLPADIQAPPISIQLSCLATLAAISDPTTVFEPTDRFINIRGSISQVSFREHPVLGTVGGYERYQTRMDPNDALFLATGRDTPQTVFKRYIDRLRGQIDKRVRPRKKADTESLFHINPVHVPFASLGRCTPFAVDMARGLLQLQYGIDPDTGEPEIINYTNASRSAFTSIYVWRLPTARCIGTVCHPSARALALMVAQTDYEIRPFPWSRFKINEVIKFLHSHYHHLFTDVKTLTRYLAPGGAHISAPSTDNFGRRNRVDDMLFEYHGSWIVQIPKRHQIGGDFGTDIVQDMFDVCSGFLAKEVNGVTTQKEQKENTMLMWMGPGYVIWWLLKHVDILLRRKHSEAVDALDTLTKKFVNEAAAEEAQKGPATETAANIVLMRSSSQDSPRDNVDASSPCSRSSVEVDPQDHVATVPEPMNATVEVPDSESPQQSGPIEAAATAISEVSEESYLESLLGLRAILFAALLKHGTDTSMLFSPDFRDAIVKII